MDALHGIPSDVLWIENGCANAVEVLGTPHGAVVEKLSCVCGVCHVQLLLELALCELRLAIMHAGPEFVESARSPCALYVENRLQDLETQAGLANAVVVKVGRLALPRAFGGVGPLGVAWEEG